MSGRIGRGAAAFGTVALLSLAACVYAPGPHGNPWSRDRYAVDARHGSRQMVVVRDDQQREQRDDGRALARVGGDPAGGGAAAECAEGECPALAAECCAGEAASDECALTLECVVVANPACEESCEEGQCEEQACEEEEACCAAEGADAATPVAPAAAAPVDPEKLDELRYAAESAARRVARAEAEREQSAIDQRHAVRRAKLDLADAQQALAHFDEFVKPMRLARAELELKGNRDYLSEQEEEMQQLELMYEKDDLGDKTKEIVLARGKRRLARAKESFALSQKEMGDLKGVELPKQREKLEREVTAKERDLERAMFQAKTSSEDKNQACVDAERAAAKAKRELQKACGDAACCEEAGEDDCCEEGQEKGADADDDDDDEDDDDDDGEDDDRDDDDDDDDDDRREDDSRSRRRREA
ncbi:MAG: hypothetical protein JNL90_18890 [Planctomycetes bacterium]|nr:hypothetical protein [Planctomycetota bacterium]